MVDPAVVLPHLDARAARRWVLLSRAALAAHRAEIDALNVFPVPDGDTGTNLYLTLDSAVDQARWVGEEPDLATAAADLARASLLAARGNSGVILSQVIRGIAEVLGAAATEREAVDGAVLARALSRASELAQASVTRPVDGTILTVAASAAAAARAAAGGPDAAVPAPEESLLQVAAAALAGGRAALARTPEQLPALRAAGVVDAGGAGYVLVLESLVRVVRGEVPDGEGASRDARPGWRTAAVGTGGEAAGTAAGRAPGSESGPRPHDDDSPLCRRAATGVGSPTAADTSVASQAASVGSRSSDGGTGPAYEVMFLLAEASGEAVDGLRRRLDQLGDSVLVVGEQDLWNVHAHVDDVGAAIEAGVEAGRPHRIVVTHFGDQARSRGRVPARRGGVGVVACVAGPGLGEIYVGAGAQVVPSAPGRRASAGQLLQAIERAGNADIVLLPNDNDTLLAAQAAAQVAQEDGYAVAVLATGSAVQGLAALAVFDPSANAADNVSAMGAAAAATRYGSVAVAGRAARTPAGPCEVGDVLGSVGDEVAVVGSSLQDVGIQVLDRLLADGGELVTLVVGSAAPDGLADAVALSVADDTAEVSVVHGGQDTYPLLLGVE